MGLRFSKNGIATFRAVNTPGYDLNAQAFFDAETAAGVSLTGTQMSATNQLVLDLKAANIWTKMMAVYPMVGGTATSHKFNLKNPLDTNAAYRLGFVGGWTHSSNGALPNGTNAYAETYIAANQSPLTNANGHISYYSRTNGTDMAHAMGYYISSLNTITAIIPRGSAYGNAQAGWMAQTNNSPSVIVTANTQGFLGVTRTATNAHKTWKNTTFSPNGANFTTINGTRNIYIGAASHPVNIQYGNFECAFSSIGDGLTDAEVLLFRTAVQTFNTTLGRQV